MATENEKEADTLDRVVAILDEAKQLIFSDAARTYVRAEDGAAERIGALAIACGFVEQARAAVRRHSAAGRAALKPFTDAASRLGGAVTSLQGRDPAVPPQGG